MPYRPYRPPGQNGAHSTLNESDISRSHDHSTGIRLHARLEPFSSNARMQYLNWLVAGRDNGNRVSFGTLKNPADPPAHLDARNYRLV